MSSQKIRRQEAQKEELSVRDKIPAIAISRLVTDEAIRCGMTYLINASVGEAFNSNMSYVLYGIDAKGKAMLVVLIEAEFLIDRRLYRKLINLDALTSNFEDITRDKEFFKIMDTVCSGKNGLGNSNGFQPAITNMNSILHLTFYDAEIIDEKLIASSHLLRSNFAKDHRYTILFPDNEIVKEINSGKYKIVADITEYQDEILKTETNAQQGEYPNP